MIALDEALNRRDEVDESHATARPQLRVVTAGNVDHGKSTLIARLLADTGNLPEGKVEEVRAAAERRGVPFEWSFVLDALQGERDQAVTIDTTQRWLRGARRDVVLIDAPGHEQFLRNMVTGASNADAALLVVDAAEGVVAQTRRHVLALELLGVGRACVVLNKLDRVEFSHARYEELRGEVEELFASAGIALEHVVPIVARDGDNVVARSIRMPWYAGPTIAQALDALPARRARRDDAPLRLAVQGVLRRDEERIVLGRIESGTLRVGDEIAIAPGERRERIARILSWPEGSEQPTVLVAGTSAALVLAGPTFVERGDVLAALDAPPQTAHSFRARLLWLGSATARTGDKFAMRIGTRATGVVVRRVERVINLVTLAHEAPETITAGDIADVVFEAREPLALEAARSDGELGRFVLTDRAGVVAGGIVLEPIPDPKGLLVAPVHELDSAARAQRLGHRGAVIWFTGLPGSGKSTLATALERRLFDRGVWPVVLDGDELRGGLNADLGFSPDDRFENVRRTGEVAALIARAGAVALVSLVSPSAEARALARRAAGDAFAEVYVKADAATCAARDPKGHYAKAHAGELPQFTGVGADYEVPAAPELVVDSENHDAAHNLAVVEAFVLGKVALHGPGPAERRPGGSGAGI